MILMTKLSIITINRNNAEGLRKTIESVVSQTYTDFEYIIIDGASTDCSVDIIKEYADKITFWVSEPDNGIYNAMNKGILKAKGEYLLFLNSGDWLVDEDVVGDFCNLDYKDDVVIGDIYLVKNGITTLQKSVKKEDFGFHHFYYGGFLPHQSAFIRRELFITFGLYNESFKIAADFDFFVKVLLTKNASYNYFERIVSYFDFSGISSQSEMNIIHGKERKNIFQTHVPLIFKTYKINENKLEELQSHERDYREYINLKNGKTRIIIKLLLFLKNIKKKL